jgi:UDP-galactopyranose mutase
LDTDYFANREYLNSLAENIVFTGKIDEYYGFQYGKLSYRSLRFETEVLDNENYQGNAVVNYTSKMNLIQELLSISILNLGHKVKLLLLKNIP